MLRTAIPIAITAFLTSALTAQKVGPSGGVLIPEQACYDVQHYDLSLRVDPDNQSIEGSVTLTAIATKPTSLIGLDLDSHLKVTGIESPNRKCSMEVDDQRIFVGYDEEIAEGEKITLTIRYGGKPRVAPRPPWEGGFTWAKTPAGKPWIATSCQGQGADLWWPCKDHPSDKPATMDLRIEVPDDLVVASNGVLESNEDLGDGWRRFHWHVANPISNYCVALNIAPYVVLERDYECVTGETFPAKFWVLPSHEKRGEKAFTEFLEHLRHMEELCGPYPFRNEKYGIVETPHLGMEHQTIIAYGNKFQQQAPGYDWLHHHELSHEWWANLVTCRDWKDMWIHEGIGTYMQALYLEKKFGPEAMHAKVAADRRNVMNRRAVAPRETQDTRQIYFSLSGNDIYYKGSCIMHTLRWLLSDPVFFLALRRMAYPDPATEKVTDGSQVRLTDSAEIVAIVEDVADRELGWFFDLYLHQPHLPELKTETIDGNLHLTWKTPGDVPFPLPVPVEVGGVIHRVAMPGGKGSIDLDGQKFDIDPDEWLLQK